MPDANVVMHKDMFDKCRHAIDAGFYFEAIVLEYAAIESRLEILLGVLELPCNKELPPAIRKEIKISNRIRCLNHARKHSCSFASTKLDLNLFSDKGILREWVRKRDTFIHGLYKSVGAYHTRLTESEELAKEGYALVKLLYNEAKRLRRLKAKHPDQFQSCAGNCRCDCCKANPNKADGKKT